MSATRDDRERELWDLAESPAGMRVLCRQHNQVTGRPSGIQTQHTTADVGPMIVRILDREFPRDPHRGGAAGPLSLGTFRSGAEGSTGGAT